MKQRRRDKVTTAKPFRGKWGGLGYFGTHVPEHYLGFENELRNQVFHNIKFGGANILLNDPFRKSFYFVLRNHLFRNSIHVYYSATHWEVSECITDPYTRCGMGGSATKTVPKYPTSKLQIPLNLLKYTINLTIDDTYLK